MNILFIGDIVGRPGRNLLKTNLSDIIQKHQIDFVIANGENASGGLGITKETYADLMDMGMDVITLGNHTWSKKETAAFIFDAEHMIRPANFPDNNPGNGYIILTKNDKRIAVINLCGRVFMDPVECPFKTMDRILEVIKPKADIIIVDFHAEATSEKQALGWYLDGRVTAVLGTHTHIPTADERILHHGTAYITDVGMTGSYDSVLGVEKELIINKFLTMMPCKFEVAAQNPKIGAVIINISEDNKATGIYRVRFQYCEKLK